MVMMAPIDFKKPQLPIKKIDPALIDKMNFAFKDQDGNGRVSRDEWVGGAEGKQRFAKELEFRKHDLNGDGTLTQEEYLASREVERLKKKPPVFERIGDWFKKIPMLQQAPEWAKPWVLKAPLFDK